MPMGSAGVGGGYSGGLGAGNASYPSAFTARAGQSVSGSAVMPGMMDVYNQLLNLNQNNYSNLLGAYSNANGALDNQLSGIYNTLGINTGGWGVAQPAADAIASSYAKARGSNLNSMINSGLGNSTLLGQMQNQAAGMAGQSYGNLGAQLANTAAGYQAQIAGMRNQLAGGFIGNLAGYKFANTAGDLTGHYSASMQGGGSGGGGSGGGSRGGSGGGSGYGDTLNIPRFGDGPAMGYSGGYNPGFYGGYGNQTPTGDQSFNNPYQMGGQGNGTTQATNDYYSSSDYYNQNPSYGGYDPYDASDWTYE